MRTWTTAQVEVTCGGPHATWTLIPAGAPVLLITGAGRPRVRCMACAGEPVPDGPRPVAMAAARPAMASFREALGDVLDGALLRWE